MHIRSSLCYYKIYKCDFLCVLIYIIFLKLYKFSICRFCIKSRILSNMKDILQLLYLGLFVLQV